MKIVNKKPTIAIVSLTCCEGCQVAILDLGERFLNLAQHVKIGDFAFLEEKPETEKYDVVFVEGAPITEENIARLKDLRQRSKFLAALGACAALGGIAEIKNYQDKNERLRYVYKNFEGINNPDIKPLSFYVKVDLEIPGCPINNEEFFKIIKDLMAGIPPKIKQQPVCYECQLKQNECLLQKGEPCLGPIMLGGCGAPCPLTPPTSSPAGSTCCSAPRSTGSAGASRRAPASCCPPYRGMWDQPTPTCAARCSSSSATSPTGISPPTPSTWPPAAAFSTWRWPIRKSGAA